MYFFDDLDEEIQGEGLVVDGIPLKLNLWLHMLLLPILALSTDAIDRNLRGVRGV